MVTFQVFNEKSSWAVSLKQAETDQGFPCQKVCVLFQVYSSALRAQRRSKLMVDQWEEEARTAPQYEKRRRAQFNECRTANGWDTEYRRNYVGYDGETYGKVLSARMHPLKHPSAFFIPA